MAWGKKLGFIVFLCIHIATITNAQGMWEEYTSFPKYETRAVWVGTIGGIDWPRKKVAVNSNRREASIRNQKEEFISLLNNLQKANINTILLQTRIRGSVIYPSDIEPWDDCLTGHFDEGPGYDPLAFVIEECHKRGMDLHAWLVTIPVGTSAKQKKLGSKALIRSHPELCKTVRGEVFMLPGKTETAEYVASICKEIAEKYDIDGISLDYIRYPEASYSFNDNELYRKYTSSVSDPLSLADWRRENISRIVKAVHDAVKPIKPWVKLSSSPLGRYDDLPRYTASGWDCFNAVYQDPKQWLDMGWQDELFPMMYFQGNLFFPFLFNWKEISSGHPVSAGLGIYFLDPKEGRKWTLNEVRAQIHTARKSDVGGVCFYRSQYLTGNYKGIYNAVCNEFFPCPSLPQPMTWMRDSVKPERPTGLKRSGNTLKWDEVGGDVTYNIYASFTSPVDITRGENLLVAKLPKNMTNCPIQDAALFYAVTSMDRYGNESEPIQELWMPTGFESSDKVVTNAIRQHFSQPVNLKKSKKNKKR